MANANYVRGANRERQLQHRLEDQGWIVQRSAGSKGVCDLVALRRGECWLLEVKTTKTPFQTFGPEERRAMKAAAEIAGAQAMLVHWAPNKVCRWLPSDGWPE